MDSGFPGSVFHVEISCIAVLSFVLPYSYATAVTIFRKSLVLPDPFAA
jgi:hypothetical protein